MYSQSLFSNVEVTPAHGTRNCLISWVIPVANAGDDVYVYFSPDGVKGSWTLLTKVPLTNTLTYMDTEFHVHNRTQVGYYRLLLDDGTKKHDSGKVPIYDILSRKEFGIVHKCMQNEWKDARGRNGVPMFHCVVKSKGEPAESVDPDTGVKRACDVASPSYGQDFVGGFWSPMLTWVRIQTIDIGNGAKDSLDAGIHDPGQINVRLFGFPKPARGHMFVDPVTDNRWVVDDKSVKSYMIRGAVPIAHSATLALLQRNDVRYKLAMPGTREDITNFRTSRFYEPYIATCHSSSKKP